MAIHRAWKRPWNKVLRRVASSLGLVCYQVAETCLPFFPEPQRPLPVRQRIGKTFQRQGLSQSILCPTLATISERITQSTNEVLNVLIRPFYRHDRISECGTSDVAMMGIRTSAPLFARDAKIRQISHRFSRGRRNRFLHH